MKVLLITVDYNSEKTTNELLRSLDEVNTIQFLVKIIYNGSPPKSKPTIKNHKLKTIQYENKGYFPAINKGLSNENTNKFDFIIACNNDITIPSKSFSSQLRNHLKTNYAVIAPKIRTKKQLDQNPHRKTKPQSYLYYCYKIYYSSYFLAKFIYELRRTLKKLYNKNPIVSKTSHIFSPHGAFIIFTNHFFNNGGIIDNKFFMYAEEDSIASQCFEKKLEILHDPTLEVNHLESTSLGQNFNKYKWLLQKSGFNYTSKYHRNIFL